MSDKLKKTLIGALVAVALAIAVSYGLISQQTADQIQNQTNQALQDNRSTSQPSTPAPSQSAPPPTASQTPGTQAPATPPPPNPAPAAHQ